jgi:hypothetical protein
MAGVANSGQGRSVEGGSAGRGGGGGGTSFGGGGKPRGSSKGVAASPAAAVLGSATVFLLLVVVVVGIVEVAGQGGESLKLSLLAKLSTTAKSHRSRCAVVKAK